MKKEVHSFITALVMCFILLFIFQVGCDEKKKDMPPETGDRLLYERNLGSLVKKGHFVAVDQNESDRFIQEDIYSMDYGILLELTMIKSESMGIPLYIEDARTLGKEGHIERIDPTDRKARQDFLITETRLLNPSYFSQKKFLDDTYNRAEAMDKKRTLNEMIRFVKEYPHSKWASRAISYIEYQLCAVQKDPDMALKVYEKIKKNSKDNKQLSEILDFYIRRVPEYKRLYEAEDSEK